MNSSGSTKLFSRRLDYQDFYSQKTIAHKQVFKILLIATQIIVSLAMVVTIGLGMIAVAGGLPAIGHTIAYLLLIGGSVAFVVNKLAIVFLFSRNLENKLMKVPVEKLSLPLNLLSFNLIHCRYDFANSSYEVYELTAEAAERIMNQPKNYNKILIIRNKDTHQHVVYFRKNACLMHVGHDDLEELSEDIKFLYPGNKPLRLVFNNALDEIIVPWINKEELVIFAWNALDFDVLQRNFSENNILFYKNNDSLGICYRENKEIIQKDIHGKKGTEEDVIDYVNRYLKPKNIIKHLPWLNDDHNDDKAKRSDIIF
ncbi:MAG: hypothetical protein KDK55_04785 [Chlamydiia bacterium]|nr:hypothetical protein [Chlamydiia bacterium]